jgi:hypothetical protein
MQWLARVFASAVARRLGYVAVGVVVALVGQCAHALETVPAKPRYTVQCVNQSASDCVGGIVAGTDRATICAANAFNGFFAGAGGTLSASYNPAYGTYGECLVNNNGSLWAHQAFSQSGVVCPAHSTGPGGIAPNQFCTCDNGYSANGGACVIPDACAPSLGVPMGSQGQEFMVGVASKTGAPTQVCTGGCNYIPRATGGGAGVVGQLGSQYTYIGMDSSQWIGTGVSCTGAPVGGAGTPTNPPQPYPTPLEPGKCPGTVNGVAVVVPCDSTTTTTVNSPGGAASSASSTASSPAGTAAGTSNKNTETTCTATTCTTTTTTTTNNANGTTTTTKDTENEDKGDFCSEHPGNPQCADEEEKDPCDDAPDRAACKNLGTLEATPLQNVNVPLAIAPSSGFGPSSASCPAPQTATLLGRTYSFSWQPFCDLAVGIRPVVIALAWLSAAIGFLGLSRKGN